MRVRPRRETRGVSRSKCGDLITATVPVSWAASIIINESTDAIDFYDGFGTTEMVVGIRAYQWGWEYYYPKDLDLNYNLKHNYSAFVGNSLKYNSTSALNLKSTNLWKFYQNKSMDSIVTPAHLLLLPLDNYKILNFLNFNDVGMNNLNEPTAFKKIKMFSKTFNTNLNFLANNYTNKFKTLEALYTSTSLFSDSYLYGLKRQHNFLNSKSYLNSSSTFFDLKSVHKVLNSSWKKPTTAFKTYKGFSNLNFTGKILSNQVSSTTINLNNLFYNFFPTSFNKITSKLSLYPTLFETINNDTDKKKFITHF